MEWEEKDEPCGGSLAEEFEVVREEAEEANDPFRIIDGAVILNGSLTGRELAKAASFVVVPARSTRVFLFG